MFNGDVVGYKHKVMTQVLYSYFFH